MKMARSFVGLSLLVLASWSGCDSGKNRVCGDGFIDPSEDCDGTVGEFTCGALGHYHINGLLRCNADCSFDLSDCGGKCGDGLVETTYNEVCDTDNLGSATCISLGFSGGTLLCSSTCQFDTSQCESTCGNGLLDAWEVCDGAQLGGNTCLTLGYSGGALSCSVTCGYDESNCQSVCGNGLLEPDEQCDGNRLRGLTCESIGYDGGVLECNTDCTLDRSACEGTSLCGDGTVDPAESCDGVNLDQHTCLNMGYTGGTLQCGLDCRFDLSRCLGATCGNGYLDQGEACEPGVTFTRTCADLGYTSGTLACASDCQWNSVGCFNLELCGNELIDPGEECDGTDLNQETCQALGYYGGELFCDASCRFGTQDCDAVGRCGDGTIQGIHGEECDATSLAGLTCAEVTPSTPVGELSCDGECRFDTTGCLPDPSTMVFIPVNGGSFQRDATPTNVSTVSAFHISRTEITRAQFLSVMGADPTNLTYSTGLDDPAQNVTWYQALAFCNKLSLQEGRTPVYSVSGVDFTVLAFGDIPTSSSSSWNAATADWMADGYRLPTEMEWMWAAMGADLENPGAVNTTGYLKPFAGSDGTNLLGDFSVFGYSTVEVGRTQNNGTSPVGSKLANELGLFDMSGNVREWVWDKYDSYPNGTLVDYHGSTSGGQNRSIRGGNWYSAGSFCTITVQNFYYPYSSNSYIGLRVVRRQ